MLQEMSWEQFREWMYYAEVEPFGEERGDLQAGIVASVIANVNRDPKKGKPFSPGDFMPRFLDVGSEDGGRVAKRAPLTDPGEWARVKQMAKALKGKKVI